MTSLIILGMQKKKIVHSSLREAILTTQFINPLCCVINSRLITTPIDKNGVSNLSEVIQSPII